MGTVRYYGAEDVRDGEYGPALQRLADELRGGVLVVTTLAGRPGPTDAGLLFCARHGDPFICDITGGYYLGRVRHVDPHGGEWSATVWDADRGHANLLPGWVHQAAGQADVDREAQGEPAVQAVVGCDGPRMVWITLLALPDAGIPRSLWELESIVAVFCGGFGGPTREVPLPAEVGQLPNLEHLMLRGNRLTAVPSEIGQLHELQTLDLSGNELEELPTTMRQLDNLRVLFLHGNDALDIPPEVLGRD